MNTKNNYTKDLAELSEKIRHTEEFLRKLQARWEELTNSNKINLMAQGLAALISSWVDASLVASEDITLELLGEVLTHADSYDVDMSNVPTPVTRQEPPEDASKSAAEDEAVYETKMPSGATEALLSPRPTPPSHTKAGVREQVATATPKAESTNAAVGSDTVAAAAPTATSTTASTATSTTTLKGSNKDDYFSELETEAPISSSETAAAQKTASDSKPSSAPAFTAPATPSKAPTSTHSALAALMRKPANN
jgi:hypothetical protein